MSNNSFPICLNTGLTRNMKTKIKDYAAKASEGNYLFWGWNILGSTNIAKPIICNNGTYSAFCINYHKYVPLKTCDI